MDRNDDEATITMSPAVVHHGDQVTFSAEVTGINGWAFWGECHQDLVDPETGEEYKDATVLWFGGRTRSGDQTISETVTLDSPAWESGAARCWVGIRNYDKSNYPRRTVYEGLVEFDALAEE